MCRRSHSANRVDRRRSVGQSERGWRRTPEKSVPRTATPNQINIRSRINRVGGSGMEKRHYLVIQGEHCSIRRLSGIQRRKITVTVVSQINNLWKQFLFLVCVCCDFPATMPCRSTSAKKGRLTNPLPHNWNDTMVVTLSSPLITIMLVG